MCNPYVKFHFSGFRMFNLSGEMLDCARKVRSLIFPADKRIPIGMRVGSCC